MKKRTHKMFVEDILEAMDKIERYIKGLTYETFALYSEASTFATKASRDCDGYSAP